MMTLVFKNIPQRKIFRLIMLVLLLSAFLGYRFFYSSDMPSCLQDRWHAFTASANNNLDINNNDNIVIGIGQVIMDSWIVLTFIYWLIKLKNTRFGVCIVFFFLSRYVHLNIMKFPFPDHMVWHNPGFYSLTVPYDKTRDFYYSGHTGTLTIIMLQYFTLNEKWPFLVVLVCLLYTMSMLTITRVHYTIDVIGGLCFAFCCYRLGIICTYYVDYFLCLPYLFGKKIKQRYNKKQQAEPLLARNQILY